MVRQPFYFLSSANICRRTFVRGRGAAFFEYPVKILPFLLN
jgi:hypothetical protein